MTLIRKKIPKSGYLLIAIVVVAIIALPILHFTGIFDLSFVGDWAIMAADFAALSGWNAAIIGGLCAGVGFGICYTLKDYIIGMEGDKLTVTNNSNTYTPVGQTIGSNNQTVVSQ